MAGRQRTALQVNQFVGGLNTEANPLSYPANNSYDEVNLELNRDGSRRRRPGFDVEEFFVHVPTGVTYQTGKYMARNQFRWENVGGDPSTSFMVVQIGNYIGIHNLVSFPISQDLIYSKLFDVSTYSTTFGFAVVDGNLIIATGQKNIYVLEYNGTSIIESQKSLLIRDLFGVEATVNSVTLTDSENTQERPSTLTNPHVYNLRNQTFALPRADDANNTTLRDPIDEFYAGSGSTVYPSNGDAVNPFLFADSTFSSDREVERYFGGTAFRTAPSSAKAPIGYFIIDALERGASRLDKIQALQNRHSALSHPVSNGLLEDRTPDGASVVAQYAGRVWYGGFSGEVINGDSKSPRLSSYLLFSQIVNDPSEINLCYQAADPTSNEDPDVVDTDGGFIKLDGAYGVKALAVVSTSLFVFAENGVWRITGVDENTFTATQYTVSKLTNQGCISGTSVVVNKNRVLYWGEDSIYGIEQNQLGVWEAIDLSEATIQTVFDNIPVSDKRGAVGYFDGNSNAVRWVYGSDLTTRTKSQELILSIRFSAFSKSEINLSGENRGIISVAGGDSGVIGTDGIVTNSLLVSVTDSLGDLVTVPRPFFDRDKTDAYYCVITELSPLLKYTFGRYNRFDTKYDWTRLGSQTDTPAYIETGPVTGGDARLFKDVPYLTAYFYQADPDEENYIAPSCLLRVKWDWAPRQSTGKWSSSRQIYRVIRASNGQGVLPTRNKVRGNGKAVAFRMESEEGKDLWIYGWECNLQATAEE